MDYIHYNPVKHGLATCPHAWPHSTFARHVQLKNYESDWHCRCYGNSPKPPSFNHLPQFE
jgi:putative transposase